MCKTHHSPKYKIFLKCRQWVGLWCRTIKFQAGLGLQCSLLTELLPGAEEAMVLRVTRNTNTNAENKPKISMAGAKRWPVATFAISKPGLRPTALGDIPNKISEQPQAKLPLKRKQKKKKLWLQEKLLLKK